MIDRLTQSRNFLDNHGFNLFAVLDLQTMPEMILQPLRQAEIALSSYQRMILMGAAGLKMWEHLKTFGFKSDNPVDHFSQATGERCLQEYFEINKWLTVFPSNIPLPLQQLGELAGWSHPSPLGLSIHPEYGTWFAYRAVFLVDDDVPVTRSEKTNSPCDTCIDTPCVSVCSVGAVSVSESLKLESCINYRLKEVSPCATRCLARMTCPVGKEYRYTDEQLAYHGNVSLNSLIRYRAESD